VSNVFVIIKMCYVRNQWYDISCATLYFCGARVNVGALPSAQEIDLCLIGSFYLRYTILPHPHARYDKVSLEVSLA